MRRLVLPTCLLLAAWTHPAGFPSEFEEHANLDNVSVVAKTTAIKASADDTTVAALPEIPNVATPSESTVDLTFFSDELSVYRNEQPGEAETAQLPLIPLPPRRAIPHTQVCQELALAAADNNVPAPFLIKLINQESGFNQNAVSPVGAQGVAQFMPETAARMRLDDPFNPLKAVHASAQLLRNLLEQFGNKLGLAAAAYNAGPKRVQDWLAKKGSLPKETRDYVERITGRKADDWKAQKVSAQFRVPAHAPCQREAGLYASNGPAAIPLPPVHPGSEPIVVAHAGKAKGQKAIIVASADTTASIPVPQKKQSTGAKAKIATTKTVTVTIAAKRTAKSGKTKKLQVADARPHK